MLAGGGYDLGLMLDGDADRAGAADEKGPFIHQLEVTGLLMYYLAEYRGLRDPVVISVNNTSMAARLGEHYGIKTYETSVGFKYIGPKMIETGAMMGGEESGGFGFGMHLPERDGVYADLLLLDLFLRERAAGRWPVSKALAHFHELAGPSFYRRVDVHVDRPTTRRSRTASSSSCGRTRPTELAGHPVVRTQALDTNDGFKFFVADGSWLLVRFSGTEPLVRVYTEATSPDARDAMIAAGERLVRGADRTGGTASRAPGGSTSRGATAAGLDPTGDGDRDRGDGRRTPGRRRTARDDRAAGHRPAVAGGGRSSGWVARRWAPTSSGPRSPTAPACRSS